MPENRCYICGKAINPKIDYARMRDKNGNESLVHTMSLNPQDPTVYHFCRDHLRCILFLNQMLNPMLAGMNLDPLEEMK